MEPSKSDEFIINKADKWLNIWFIDVLLGILYFMPAVCVISRILGYSQKYLFV